MKFSVVVSFAVTLLSALVRVVAFEGVISGQIIPLTSLSMLPMRVSDLSGEAQ